MAPRKKSIVQQMVKESLKDLREEQGFPDDPGLDADEVTGPERFAVGQKRKDEIVIDSLLADISGKDGYFIKLKKEVQPNTWMLMKLIEVEWRQWADIEASVASIVKEYTKKSPQKWGSGAYRVEIACKSGMRGKGYSPLDLYINAEEEFVTLPGQQGALVPQVIDPNVAVASKIEELSGLVGMLKTFMPAQPDPAKTQEQIAGAFEKGLSIKAGEGSSNNQMMMTMMTGLMGMMTALATNNNKPVEKSNDGMKEMLETLKTFGVLGAKETEKPKTMVETLTELKMLGLDIFKKDDPMEQIGKLKQFAGIASDLMGMGGTTDRPSILEKLVDAIGPALPTLLKDAKEAMGSAVQVQVEAGKNIERAKMNTPQQIGGGDMRVQKEVPNTQPVQQNPQVVMFFNQLHEAVRNNNRMFYPIVYTSLLQEAQGQALLQGIVAGTHNAQHIIELLQGHGDPRFKESEFVVKYLVGYVNGFLLWIKNMMGGQSNTSNNGNGHVEPMQSTPHGEQDGGFDVGCPICQAVYGYSSEQDFADEPNKECGANVNGVKCPGTLQPMAQA